MNTADQIELFVIWDFQETVGQSAGGWVGVGERAPHTPKWCRSILNGLLAKTTHQLSQKHRVATPCFDCFAKNEPLCEGCKQTIKI